MWINIQRGPEKISLLIVAITLSSDNTY